MPQPLTSEEINSQADPSVSKQYDETTPKHEQFEELYKLVDGLKAGLLTTIRPNIGPVSRSMAVARRTGPDFLFLANIHSNKFKDLESSKQVQITFQDSKSQDWVSITGEATTTSNEDSRIKDVYSPMISAWLGDLGDGVYTGKAEDPRVALIEVRAKYITYWKSTVGTLGFLKEVGVAVVTGQVAENGVLRRFFEDDIEAARRQV